MDKKLKPRVTLIDDGTMDTVIKVENQEYRFNFDGGTDGEGTYEDFIAWAKEEALDAWETEQGDK